MMQQQCYFKTARKCYYETVSPLFLTTVFSLSDVELTRFCTVVIEIDLQDL